MCIRDRTITLTAKNVCINTEENVQITAKKNIDMTVEADINSSAKGNLLLQADKDVLTAAKGNVGIEAKSDINMVGKNIAVEGNSKITLNGGQTQVAGQQTTIQGAANKIEIM